MASKKVLFVADSLDNAHKFHDVLVDFDVEVVAGSLMQLNRLISANPDVDLVIMQAHGDYAKDLSSAERLLSECDSASLLIIVESGQLKNLRLPIQTKSDFVMSSASSEECSARVRQLLWPGNEISSSDFISVDNMTINLATYQVKVNGKPLDLTYLEYALLSFLVTHPGKTYSRDALLRRVWGFDYYGGSRTVDVHVRRVRAKLGPDLAQRLETIRGVGYLWTV